MTIAFNLMVIAFLLFLMLKLFAVSLTSKVTDRERNTLLWIALLAALLKLSAVGFWYWQVGRATDNLWLDTYDYNDVGRYLAQQFRSGVFTPRLEMLREGASPGYHYIVGFIYTLFGYHQWMVSLLNTLMGVGVALIMYHVAHRLFREKAARYTLIFVLLYPPLLYWGYFILKELAVTLAAVLLAWAVVKYSQGQGGAGTLLVLVLGLAMLLFMRPQYALVLGMAGALHWALRPGAAPVQAGGARRAPTWGQARAILAGVLLAVALFAAISYIKPRGGEGIAILQSPIRFTTLYHSDPSALFKGGRLDDPADLWRRVSARPDAFIRHSLESVFRTFWISTQPYARSGPGFYHVLEDLGGIMMVILMPMVIWGWLLSLRHQLRETLLFFLFIAVATFGFIFSGHPSRLGLPLMPFVLMFGGLGWARFHEIRLPYVIYLVLFGLLVAANATFYQSFVAIPGVILSVLLWVGWGVWRSRRSHAR